LIRNKLNLRLAQHPDATAILIRRKRNCSTKIVPTKKKKRGFITERVVGVHSFRL
jgi:hypothetical protein